MYGRWFSSASLPVVRVQLGPGITVLALGQSSAVGSGTPSADTLIQLRSRRQAMAFGELSFEVSSFIGLMAVGIFHPHPGRRPTAVTLICHGQPGYASDGWGPELPDRAGSPWFIVISSREVGS